MLIETIHSENMHVMSPWCKYAAHRND